MLFRSIWKSLEAWKSREHHPLVISGLHQTGKTFIVREFARHYYEHVVYIDLRANRLLHHAFDGDFNVNTMVMSLTANIPSARFVPGKTVVILDEIQDCPNARSSLKYWDLDGRFDVIATGSFLGVKGFREPYIRGIPVGYEESLSLHPLTFFEFLKSMGIADSVIDFVAASINDRRPVEKAVHESMRALFLQYLIVGGMPEAVNTFIATHDINAVQEVQRRILTSIRDDFGRYKDRSGNDKINEVLKLRAEACLDSLPAQLSKEYKKFQYSLVHARGNSPEKADGLQYILDVGLAIRAFNVRAIDTPLESLKIPTEFKVFYADTGLLVSQLEAGTAAVILRGELGAYKGAIAENMVAAALSSNGFSLYYLHDSTGSPELDFIYSDEGVPTIIECKATNRRATSMKYVIANPKKYGTHPAVKYADTNIGIGEGFITLPLYAIGFIKKVEPHLLVPKIEINLP